MLEFLNVDSDTFKKKACHASEEDLSAWVILKNQKHSSEEKDAANHKILRSQPDSPDKWQTFHEIRDNIDPSRTDITTWVDLIDLDEGRL